MPKGVSGTESERERMAGARVHEMGQGVWTNVGQGRFPRCPALGLKP